MQVPFVSKSASGGQVLAHGAGILRKDNIVLAVSHNTEESVLAVRRICARVARSGSMVLLVPKVSKVSLGVVLTVRTSTLGNLNTQGVVNKHATSHVAILLVVRIVGAGCRSLLLLPLDLLDLKTNLLAHLHQLFPSPLLGLTQEIAEDLLHHLLNSSPGIHGLLHRLVLNQVHTQVHWHCGLLLLHQVHTQVHRLRLVLLRLLHQVHAQVHRLSLHRVLLLLYQIHPQVHGLSVRLLLLDQIHAQVHRDAGRALLLHNKVLDGAQSLLSLTHGFDLHVFPRYNRLEIQSHLDSAD
mmetsp:Transcript_12562/g.28927  ORF Transcript_12562/g.28927 Transcript_12562/m.28927 type:complete len:296 (+) Transcript_12562:224-1111(+)